MDELEDLLVKQIERSPEEVKLYSEEQLQNYLKLVTDVIRYLVMSPGRTAYLDKHAHKLNGFLQRLSALIKVQPSSTLKGRITDLFKN